MCRSRASTSRRSASLPPRSGPCGSRSPTRARASATRTSRFAARRARQSRSKTVPAAGFGRSRHPPVTTRDHGPRPHHPPPADPPPLPRPQASQGHGRAAAAVGVSDPQAHLRPDHRRRQRRTLASASSVDRQISAAVGFGGNKQAAEAIGKAVAERALAAGVKQVCFDRGSFRYHGRVAALADAARAAGLEF